MCDQCEQYAEKCKRHYERVLSEGEVERYYGGEPDILVAEINCRRCGENKFFYIGVAILPVKNCGCCANVWHIDCANEAIPVIIMDEDRKFVHEARELFGNWLGARRALLERHTTCMEMYAVLVERRRSFTDLSGLPTDDLREEAEVLHGVINHYLDVASSLRGRDPGRYLVLRMEFDSPPPRKRCELVAWVERARKWLGEAAPN